MISGLIGVLVIWLVAVDRILHFQTEVMREADRDTALATVGALMSSYSWVRFCWAFDLP
jgi:hypothetical protein